MIKATDFLSKKQLEPVTLDMADPKNRRVEPEYEMTVEPLDPTLEPHLVSTFDELNL
ncbi:hypothetical protein BGZ83_009652, partial [Gryganskiella cystojenkinii]